MNVAAIALILIGSVSKLHAQEDSVQRLISHVLFSKKVYPKVFFEYSGIGPSPHILAPGKYAFVYPDSIIKRLYPDIIEDLSITWAREKKLYTKTYLRSAELGTVFIKSNINSDPNLKFYLTFSLIEISGSNAHVKFETSCNCADYNDGLIFTFDAYLSLRREKWRINQLKISQREGCR